MSGVAKCTVPVDELVRLKATVGPPLSPARMAELFPFLPASDQPVPADTVAENDLVEATALPLGRERREVLLEASLPAGKAKKKRASTKR